MTAMINKLPMLPHSPLSESPGVPLQATESFVGILRSPREGGNTMHHLMKHNICHMGGIFYLSKR